ncbi:S-adenosyl-L-methionine-dependent methyltransferase [Gonapodya prolifera JEL478]|uniref:S-adenosyl-L-methionine-dependent methyltransferase n=1 Tax=Gonapodya prolifera (strain JEL478) TaxID=1344416 RepID=A0A138ZXB9_GONPJ|nr:S-adenosyl-L-methionine-dependent methyltransferase [Gonapodya prolifera JEL478]|eukprot:KXS09146.1 S-adenosyl-L-methionine-dependent methyltransferase [Gonapodya prolifera JEL478]
MSTPSLHPSLTLLPHAQTAIASLLSSPSASPSTPLAVLEVGCGDGKLAHAIATEFGARVAVTAIDPFPAAITAAQSAFPPTTTPNLSFIQSDLLSFYPSPPTRLFDIILCQRSLHHVFPLADATSKLHSLVRTSGVLIADEFARDEVTEAGARFLVDRIDVFRALGLLEDGPGSHAHGHTHDGRGQSDGHSHGGHDEAGHGHGGHESAEHGHGAGGHDHAHNAASASDHAHTPPPQHQDSRSNLSYVHGHAHVGPAPSSSSPREGLPTDPPLSRWTRMTTHDPPLPGGSAMRSALSAVFGERNVKVERGGPALYLMATHKVKAGDEALQKVTRVVREQEEREIAGGRVEGIGLLFVCRKV